jgi:hypothetical protein
MGSCSVRHWLNAELRCEVPAICEAELSRAVLCERNEGLFIAQEGGTHRYHLDVRYNFLWV